MLRLGRYVDTIRERDRWRIWDFLRESVQLFDICVSVLKRRGSGVWRWPVYRWVIVEFEAGLRIVGFCHLVET